MTVASLLGAAEARSQNFFNIALLSRVLLCGVSSDGRPGRGRPGPRRFALIAFTLVVGPTDEVRTQLAHGGAHVLSHSHRQGPDGGGLVDHRQQVPVVGQLLVESTQALLVVR